MKTHMLFFVCITIAQCSAMQIPVQDGFAFTFTLPAWLEDTDVESNDATFHQQLQLESALKKPDATLQEIERLLQAGADPNYCTTPGSSLFSSVFNSPQLSLPLLRLLFKYQINPNSRSFLETPLIMLVKKLHDPALSLPAEEKISHLNAIKLFLYHGANPYAKNAFGDSAIDIAQENNDGSLVALLSHAQANLRQYLVEILHNADHTPFTPVDIAYHVARTRYDFKK